MIKDIFKTWFKEILEEIVKVTILPEMMGVDIGIEEPETVRTVVEDATLIVPIGNYTENRLPVGKSMILVRVIMVVIIL